MSRNDPVHTLTITHSNFMIHYHEIWTNLFFWCDCVCGRVCAVEREGEMEGETEKRKERKHVGVHLCVYVYVCVRACACMYVSECVHVGACACVCVCMCACVCICLYVCVCVHVGAYVRLCARVRATTPKNAQIVLFPCPHGCLRGSRIKIWGNRSIVKSELRCREFLTWPLQVVWYVPIHRTWKFYTKCNVLSRM